jgi:L-asparaginase
MKKKTLSKILIIYTGGTIGMIRDPETDMLKPFDFNNILYEVPELKRMDCNIEAISFQEPIDSSNINSKIWKKIGDYIYKYYNNFDGFVILHGTDTMAYTASAMSFMFVNLSKPIIFTGSQLPIGTIRTDGKENLITAVEIATKKDDNGLPKLKEVAIYFENKLFRANRTTKISSDNFNAFQSFNYPVLAEAGINIKFNSDALLNIPLKELEYNDNFDNSIGTVLFFPGIDISHIEYILKHKNYRAIILITYGSGNVPISKELIDAIKKAIVNNKIILNISQCLAGAVDQKNYETGRQLYNAGVIGVYDIILEALITKLMICLAKTKNINTVKELLLDNMLGEFTKN